MSLFYSKVYNKSFHYQLLRPSTKYCSVHIPLTNPERSQDHTDWSKFNIPLQLQLHAKRDERNARVYSGNKPSVTTILEATRSKNDLYALLNWRRALIKQLGEHGYNERVSKIRKRGRTFHQAIKEYLLTGSQPTLHQSNHGHWQSIKHVIPNIDHVIALESVVAHPHLDYAGTLDGIISYRGEQCLVDWKTSEKKRMELKNCFSYPHQIVAYAGAVNYDDNYYPIQVKHGLLVIAYQDGSAADTIWLTPDTCECYWSEWLQRLRLYNQTTCKSNYGTRIQDLAHYVSGVRSDGIPVQPCYDVVKHSNLGTNLTAWSESIIDVFEMDPSTFEFEDNH